MAGEPVGVAAFVGMRRRVVEENGIVGNKLAWSAGYSSVGHPLPPDGGIGMADGPHRKEFREGVGQLSGQIDRTIVVTEEDRRW